MFFGFGIHPQIVHFTVSLIIVSFVFDVIGRSLDSSWWRKASLALLVAGVLAGGAAVLTGENASEFAEHKQGIPEATVDAHGNMGKLAGWLALGALAARVVEVSAGPARSLIGMIALLLHLGSAIAVGVAGHRGGMLVFRHGAGVQVNGTVLHDTSVTTAPK